VVKVHCTDEMGSKLVTAVGQCCKKLGELAGLDPEGTMVKREFRFLLFFIQAGH